MFQGEVLSAKDVPLAAASLFKCGDVAAGAFGSVNKVEPGIHVSRELLLEKINDDAAARRGLDVVLADRSSGIDDDDVLACTGSFDRDLLRQEFRALVGADHIVERDRKMFVCGLAV